MFRKNNTSSDTITKKIAPSVISSDMNLLGNIISEGLIDFDGCIDGNIHCHTLLVRVNARINGEVKADNIQISGKVYGTIRARNVTLQKTAHVEGVIMHEHITVEDGATVDGKLKKMTTSSKAMDNQPALLSAPTTPNMSSVVNPANDERDAEDAKIMEHIRLIASNS